MRLDKFLSNLKYGSRNEIKFLVSKGAIIVNDETIKNSSLKINPNIDVIKVDNNIVFYKEEINLMINKPLGYLSANKDNLHSVVFDLIKEPYNRFDLKIAGRLDLDSHGLLVLTTDGTFVHQITSPNNMINKTYKVVLKKDFYETETLINGIIIKDGKSNDYVAKALKIEMINLKELLITIDEGKFHQVRRMFEFIDNEVLDLKRISIGKLQIGSLEPGEYKEFERSDLF